MNASRLPPWDRDSSPNGLNERIAVLETQMVSLQDEVREIKATVTEIRDVLLQGKGAKWAIITVVSLVASVLGSLVHKLLPFWKS